MTLKTLMKKSAHFCTRTIAIRTIWLIGGGIFAFIGIVFTAVFIAMQFGLLNVRGANAVRNASLGTVKRTGAALEQKGSICLPSSSTAKAPKRCAWNQTVEWQTVSNGLIKDQAIIDRVSEETGVSSRMIAAAVVPEQLRYFTANRESFKRYFEPLKILSSMSKFSLGVSGIKQETAKKIEMHAQDPSSPFYPGDGMAALIAYDTSKGSHDTQLYNRLTDSRNHYYSYLYTALFLKEVSMQWQRAGFDVSDRPDVLITLFNIGFNASKPNPEPMTGGAIITLGTTPYSFGELGTLFYHSDELQTIFPQ